MPEIPEYWPECWSNPDFMDAQEELHHQIRKLDLKNVPVLIDAEEDLWGYRHKRNIIPTLINSPQAEEIARMKINIEGFVRYHFPGKAFPDNLYEMPATYTVIHLKERITKGMIAALIPDQQAAVINSVYAVRKDELEKRYERRVREKGMSLTLGRRLEALEYGYSEAVKRIIRAH